jgi:hypothetical protein
MGLRRCRFCEKQFEPSRFHPEQTVCSEKPCQQRRHAESRKKKLSSDPEYRQVCRDSAHKWRVNHPGYWKQYRAAKPESVERNRVQQQQRDQRQRLLHLANNTVALDLKSSAAGVWLLSPGGQDLANNTLASAQVFIVQGSGRKPSAAEPSCKQHPSGLAAALA